MDSITLTVTPASAANSVESGGIRVDGWDYAPQTIPAGRLFANSGWVRFRCIPRHNGADITKFGYTNPYIAFAYCDATNGIIIYWGAANTITLFYNGAGVAQTANWATAGAIVAGGSYLFEIRYNVSLVQLLVDGTVRASLIPTNPLSVAPILFAPGTTNGSNFHDDAVFLAP